MVVQANGKDYHSVEIQFGLSRVFKINKLPQFDLFYWAIATTKQFFTNYIPGFENRPNYDRFQITWVANLFYYTANIFQNSL